MGCAASAKRRTDVVETNNEDLAAHENQKHTVADEKHPSNQEMSNGQKDKEKTATFEDDAPAASKKDTTDTYDNIDGPKNTSTATEHEDLVIRENEQKSSIKANTEEDKRDAIKPTQVHFDNDQVKSTGDEVKPTVSKEDSLINEPVIPKESVTDEKVTQEEDNGDKSNEEINDKEIDLVKPTLSKNEDEDDKPKTKSSTNVIEVAAAADNEVK